MDASSAEVVGESGRLLVPRADLERQGLAILDQPVAILREAMRGGGSLMLPMAAVRIDPPEQSAAASPWDLTALDTGGFPATTLPQDDADWIERELAREPTAIPAAPLPLA
jgi:hypothetical protein